MRRRRAGFTLLELLVVMLLLGLMFTYAILNIDLLVPSSRLDKAARDIGGMLTRLRGMAVFHGRSHFLEYDLDEHRYRAIRPSSLAEQDAGADELIFTEWFDLPRRVRFQDLMFNVRERETNGQWEVEFTPAGEVIGHLVHLISDDIANEERNRFTVELNSITGLVTYTRSDRDYGAVKDEYDFR